MPEVGPSVASQSAEYAIRNEFQRSWWKLSKWMCEVACRAIRQHHCQAGVSSFVGTEQHSESAASQ